MPLVLLSFDPLYAISHPTKGLHVASYGGCGIRFVNVLDDIASVPFVWVLEFEMAHGSTAVHAAAD